LKLQQFGSLSFILPTKKTIAHRVSSICFGVLMQDAVLFEVAKIGWKNFEPPLPPLEDHHN
jgi:hypothetical protein